jgi:hypothetical protein
MACIEEGVTVGMVLYNMLLTEVLTYHRLTLQLGGEALQVRTVN